jgi:beta-aspartyl-peptidase (threonine type)
MPRMGEQQMPGVIVHGGAGAGAMDGARLARYRAGLAAACEAGLRRLVEGGTALDAAEAAVRSMEASGAFNAGRGACLNAEREAECDAAIMEGEGLRAGACGALRGFAHPITLARRILEETDHVLVVGDGAARLAAGFGLERAAGGPDPERLREYDEVAAKVRGLPKGAQLVKLLALLRHGAEAPGGAADDIEIPSRPAFGRAPREEIPEIGSRPGLALRPRQEEPPDLGSRPGLPIGRGDTVGAVAIDARGKLAAAVSTGGLWLKLPGRVGDSALPGAGIYADDGAGAVSATGIGEAIIRLALSRRACEAMGEGAAAPDALARVVALISQRIGPGTAGMVAIDRAGAPGAAFNTEAMGRAYLRGGMDAPVVAVARGERFPGDR